MTTLIIWLIISMLASAFFSGMEIAFVSSNRLLAEMDKEKNGLAQKALNIFYQQIGGCENYAHHKHYGIEAEYRIFINF